MSQTHPSLVRLKSIISPDALTASVLGTERSGNGIVITKSQLIVTIGYLITETEQLWITDSSNRTVPGHVVGYDHESGLGLVQALQRIETQTLEVGDSSALKVGDTAYIASSLGDECTIETQLVARAEFAGHWEYLLDEALIIAPPHTHWGGAGVVDSDDKLLGVGSLLIQTHDSEGEPSDANMVIPIELLSPIFDDLCKYGRPNRAGRPWLGFFVYDNDGDLTVINTYQDCPAELSGVRKGDVVVKVADKEIISLGDMYRSIWQLGTAGTIIPLLLDRDGTQIKVEVPSVDRDDRLKARKIH